MPGGTRICLCIVEDDLRTWVTEELLLLTWVVQPSITAQDLAAVDPAGATVVIVDRLAPHEVEQLRGVANRVIVIGADPGLGGAVVLGPKLTSRELKQAIRVVLQPPETRESAVV